MRACSLTDKASYETSTETLGKSWSEDKFDLLLDGRDFARDCCGGMLVDLVVVLVTIDAKVKLGTTRLLCEPER